VGTVGRTLTNPVTPQIPTAWSMIPMVETVRTGTGRGIVQAMITGGEGGVAAHTTRVSISFDALVFLTQ